MADEKKTITVKAHKNDKDFLDAIKTNSTNPNFTMADAFAELVAMAKRSEQSQETTEKLSLLETEISEKNVLLQTAEITLISVKAQLEDLQNAPPQTVEVENIIEKIIEKPLTGHQFICELDEPTALAARKVRKFALQDGIVTTTDGFEYANQLANYSIKKILTLKYENLL